MNHLQNLIDNATAILAARQELIDNNWVAYRDVDSETQGFWLKKAGENGWEYIGVHLREGRGVAVNLNSMMEYEVLGPVTTKEAIIAKIEEFLRKNDIADHI